MQELPSIEELDETSDPVRVVGKDDPGDNTGHSLHISSCITLALSLILYIVNEECCSLYPLMLLAIRDEL